MQVAAARSLETCSAQAREGGGSSSSATANSNVLATIVGGAAGRRRAIASPGLWMGAAEASRDRMSTSSERELGGQPTSLHTCVDTIVTNDGAEGAPPALLELTHSAQPLPAD